MHLASRPFKCSIFAVKKWQEAEALWAKLVEEGALWGADFQDWELAEAITDQRALKISMWRYGFGAGQVSFERPETVVQLRPESGMKGARHVNLWSDGLVFKSAISDAQLLLLNANAWEHFNEIDPTPARRC